MRNEKEWVAMTYKEKVDWMTVMVKDLYDDFSADVVNEMVNAVSRKYREQVVDFIITLLNCGIATLETDSGYLNVLYAKHVAAVMNGLNKLLLDEEAKRVKN